MLKNSCRTIMSKSTISRSLQTVKTEMSLYPYGVKEEYNRCISAIADLCLGNIDDHIAWTSFSTFDQSKIEHAFNEVKSLYDHTKKLYNLVAEHHCHLATIVSRLITEKNEEGIVNVNKEAFIESVNKLAQNVSDKRVRPPLREIYYNINTLEGFNDCGNEFKEASGTGLATLQLYQAKKAKHPRFIHLMMPTGHQFLFDCDALRLYPKQRPKTETPSTAFPETLRTFLKKATLIGRNEDFHAAEVLLHMRFEGKLLNEKVMYEAVKTYIDKPSSSTPYSISDRLLGFEIPLVNSLIYEDNDGVTLQHLVTSKGVLCYLLAKELIAEASLANQDLNDTIRKLAETVEDLPKPPSVTKDQFSHLKFQVFTPGLCILCGRSDDQCPSYERDAAGNPVWTFGPDGRRDQKWLCDARRISWTEWNLNLKCRYTFCEVKFRHRTKTCPEVAVVCTRCGFRGHRGQNCGKLGRDYAAYKAAWLEAAPINVWTKSFETDPKWGFGPFNMETGELKTKKN